MGKQQSSSLEGKHFYVAYMENEIVRDDFRSFSMYVVARFQTTVTVKEGNLDAITKILEPNQIEKFEFRTSIENLTTETVSSKVVEVTSDMPVIVHAFNSATYTTDSYSAIPTHHWGNEYRILTFGNDHYSIPSDTVANKEELEKSRSGEILLIAKEDNTTIYITPYANTDKGMNKFGNYEIKLNKGQCYFIKSRPTPGIKGVEDLTGTHITSDKAIGVLAGHSRTSIPQIDVPQLDSKDHLVEQMPPVNTWGKQYVAIPFSDSYYDFFKVVAAEDNTIVTVETNDLLEDYYITKAGEYITFNHLDRPAFIESTKPILIAQCMQSDRIGNIDNGTFHDPSMVILPRIESMVQRVRLFIPTVVSDYVYDKNQTVQFYRNVVMIVADSLAMENLLIDGKVVKFEHNFRQFGYKFRDLYWVRIELELGYHTIETKLGKFTGTIAGSGNVDSYSMQLVASNTIPENPDIEPPKITFTENCGEIRGVISDKDGANLGLDYVSQNLVLSKNFEITSVMIVTYPDENGMPDSNRMFEYWFDAKVINPKLDGRLVIDYADMAGHQMRLDTTYKAFLYLVDTKTLNFSGTPSDDFKCIKIKITNILDENLVIENLDMFKDARLQILNAKTLPIVIPPFDFATIDVCFFPKGDESDLIDSLTLKFKCEDYKIAISGNVEKPSLTGMTHDFEKIRIGDTVCTDVFWVNNGNKAVTITGLKFLQDLKYFKFEINGKFPITINAKDTLHFKDLCIAVDSVGFFNFQIETVDNYNLAEKVEIYAEGARPKIADIFVDWGKRRIGTKSDTTVKFTNTGNYDAIFDFDKITIKTQDINANDNVDKITNELIKENEDLTINLSYEPNLSDSRSYKLKADYNVDWKLHPVVHLEAIGEGTLPEITAYDIDFDTIIIFTYKGLPSSVIALAGGNEKLTIDEVKVISGDIASFEIAPKDMHDTILEVGEQYILPITFKPTRNGKHSIILEIANDAAPNYQRIKTYVNVVGYAIPADTLDAQLTMSQQDVWACDSTKFVADIINTGNLDLSFKDIKINSENIRAEIKKAPTINTLLKVAGTQSIEIETFALRNQLGFFELNVTLHDAKNNKDTTLTIKQMIQPKALQLQIATKSTEEVNIGENYILKLNGEYPFDSDTLVDIGLKLNLKKEIFHLISNEGILKLYNGATIRQIPVEFVRQIDELYINIKENNYEITANEKWELEIPFTILLYKASEIEPKIEVNAYSNDCFEPINLTFFANVQNICSFNLRELDFIGNLSWVRIAENPVKENLGIELHLLQDDEVKIDIYNSLGMQTGLSYQQKLKTGEYFVNFEINSLPNGTYVLSLNAQNFAKKLMFIILK